MTKKFDILFIIMLTAILVLSTSTTKVEQTIPVEVIDVRQVEQLNKTTNINEVLNFRAHCNLQIKPSGAPLRGLTLHNRPDRAVDPFDMRSRVDVNTIPIAAIDRVEVLRGPAGTLYGSDAIAGVVNILGKADQIFNSLPTTYTINPSQNLQSNGWTKMDYGYQPYNVTLNINYRKEWTTSAGLQFEPIAEWNYPIGSYYEPIEKPIRTQFYPDGEPNKELQETLGGVTITSKNDEISQLFFPTLKPNQKEGFNLTGSVGYGLPSTNIPNFYAGLQQSNFPGVMDKLLNSGEFTPAELLAIIAMHAPEGEDMNHLFFPLQEQESPCNMDMDVPVGTMWIPTDPAYQSMTTGVKFSKLSFNNQHVFASLNNRLAQDANQMRVLCMNMNKKEPAAGIKYLPYRCQDPILRELTGRMNDSNFRGVWDQARLWIYTDKATMKQINEKLASPMGESAYVMALADVGIAGGLTDKQLIDKDMFTPELLSGSAAPDYAVGWVANNILKTQPKEVAKWLDTSPDKLINLSATTADDYDRDHLVKILDLCLRAASPDLRKSALGFIKKSTPRIPAAKGKIGDLRISLYTGKEDEVKLALEVMASNMATEKPKDALEYIAKNGPGNANKAMAQTILNGMN